MSGGKGGGDVEQTVSNEPWGPLQPYLAGGYIQRPTSGGASAPTAGGMGAGQAGGWYDSGSNNSLILGYNPSTGGAGTGQTTGVPIRGLWDLSYEQAQRPLGSAYRFGPSSVAARGSLWNATRTANPLENAARNQFQRTIQGDYLTGGPGFDAAYQAGANRIIPQVSSMFSGGGRLNSGLAQTAMTQGLGDVFAGLYNQERARQLAAANQYPAMQQAQLQRLSVPVSLGESADLARRQEAFEPQQRLGWLGQQLGAVAAPNSSTQTSPSQGSTLGNLLGAGYLGSGIWNNLGLGSGLGLFGGGSAATGAGSLASLMGGGGTFASMGLPASAAGASSFLSQAPWLLAL